MPEQGSDQGRSRERTGKETGAVANYWVCEIPSLGLRISERPFGRDLRGARTGGFCLAPAGSLGGYRYAASESLAKAGHESVNDTHSNGAATHAELAVATQLDLPIDDVLILQGARTRLLTAAAQGAIDLNQLARSELAGRGLDMNGHWVGFARAAEIAAAHPVR